VGAREEPPRRFVQRSAFDAERGRPQKTAREPNQVIEFFPKRRLAGRMLAEAPQEEPGWSETQRVEKFKAVLVG
jgi:hypothetical protein